MTDQSRTRILYLDDSRLDRQLVRDALEEKHGGYDVKEVIAIDDLSDQLKSGAFDVVLSDTGRTLINGLDVIDIVHDYNPDLPVIILTGGGSEEVAVEAMKRGAADYVTKTLHHIQRLPRIIEEAVARGREGMDRRATNISTAQDATRYQDLVENVRDLLIVLAEDGTTRFINPSVERVLGYPPEEMEQYVFFDQVHPEDETAVRGAFQSVLEGGSNPSIHVFRCCHWDGKWLVLEGSFKRLSGSENTVVLGARDITQQRWAEAALRESEQQYRALIDQSVDAIYVVQDGYLVLVNKAWEKLFGYSRAEALQPTFDVSLLVSPKSKVPSLHLLTQPGQNPETDFEFTGLRRGHEDIDIEGRVANILWKGRPAQQGIYRDVTERKRTEEAVRRYAERLEVLRGIDRALLGAQTPAKIADVAAQQIQKLIACTWAGVLLVEPDDPERLTLAASAGASSLRTERGAYSVKNLGWAEGPPENSEEIIVEANDLEPSVSMDAESLGLEATSFLRVPLIMQEAFLGVLLLGGEGPDLFSSRNVDIAREVAEQLSVAVHNRRLFEAVSAAQIRLERLSHRLVEVQESERRHIALELHDEIGQVLTALNFTLDFTDAALSPSDREKIDRARELVDMLTSMVRDLSLNLRPSMLDDLGLLPALIWFLDRYQRQTGIQVQFEPRDVQGLRFRTEVETTAYRVVQEALNNVARHARVETVNVIMWTDEEHLHLEVTDQGNGFDPRQVSEARPSAGLSGMQERAALVGGDLSICAHPGQGVTISVVLPA